MSKSFKWCNSNTINSNSSCFNSHSTCSHPKVSSNMQEVVLHSHRVQELISLLHKLLRPIIFIKSIIQSIISNLCSKVQRILDYKRVSKQFKAQLSNNHQFNSSLALQLKAPSNKFTRFSLNHSSHSSLLSNNSSSSNNSRFSRLSSTKDSPKFSNRNRFSSRLLKSI